MFAYKIIEFSSIVFNIIAGHSNINLDHERLNRSTVISIDVEIRVSVEEAVGV